MKLEFKPPLPHSRFLVLPVIFAFVFLLAFFSINIVRVFAKLMAKTLKSYSTNTLAYSVTVMFMARFLAEATSPFSGNLQMSLTATNTSYKKYIKKTWVLWMIVFLVCVSLVFALPVFIDRSSG